MLIELIEKFGFCSREPPKVKSNQKHFSGIIMTPTLSWPSQICFEIPEIPTLADFDGFSKQWLSVNTKLIVFIK